MIPKSAVKLLDGDKDGSMRMYPTYLKGVIKHRALHLGGKASPPCDCRLVMTATGSLFLCMPCPCGSAIARENQAGRQAHQATAPLQKDGQWVALDPGVRTFMTAYNPSGTLVKLADGDFGRLKRMCFHLDGLMSRTPRGRPPLA